MPENEQGTTSNGGAADGRPLVFISHREEDKDLADLLRNFLRDRSNNSVEVFQSSYEGGGPTVGEILNKELGDHLSDAQVIMLIYTIADENWSYCMWECGVAYDPKNKDTRIIVLQCCKQDPAPLSERVKVLLYSETSVCQFVRQFMTSRDFFPCLGEPITGFHPEDQHVKKAGLELFSKLKIHKGMYSDTNWPAWPHMKFEIKTDNVEQIKQMFDSGNEKDSFFKLQTDCSMYYSDRYAPALFDVVNFELTETLSELIHLWRSNGGSQNPSWAEALSSQIMRAIQGRFPRPAWALFKNQETDRLHSPLLTHVRKSKEAMQFDVYFPVFEIDDDSRPVFKSTNG